MKVKIWLKNRETSYDEVCCALTDGGFFDHSCGYDGGRFVLFRKITPTEFRGAVLCLSDAGLIK